MTCAHEHAQGEPCEAEHGRELLFDGVEFDHCAAFPVAGKHIREQVQGVRGQEANGEPVAERVLTRQPEHREDDQRAMRPRGAMRETEDGREVDVCEFDADGKSDDESEQVDAEGH